MGVVITGLGVLAGAIAGADQLGEVLRGSSPIPMIDVDRSGGYHLPESTGVAKLASGVDLKPWLSPGESRRMSRPSKFAVAAARMAVKDANVDVAGPRTAIVLASAFSAVESTEQILKSAFGEGPESASPFTFAESVANAPAAQIAIALKAEGRNVTIPQREAGTLTAIGRGAAEIEAGRADIVLAGGVEEMSPLLHAILDRFESLAAVARPFDRMRSGFVASEGACVVVLEDEERARARGASIRVRVRGFAGAFDATAPRVGWGNGAQPLAAAIRRMLDRAGVSTREIGRIVSGASGSVTGDRLEARTLREVWNGDRLPPVIAPKGATGEYGGGFLGAAVLAAQGAPVGATDGFQEVDPELGIVPYDGSELPPASTTLVTSLASGGSASWLLLENAR